MEETVMMNQGVPLWGWAVVAFYFMPLIIALIRKHQSKLAIIFVNVFLGWTGVGWLVAMIWSLTGVVRPGNK